MRLKWILIVTLFNFIPFSVCAQAQHLSLASFTEQVAQLIYRYDFKQLSQNRLRHYFTEQGWRRYRHALMLSKNLQFVAKHRMHVEGTVLDNASLAKQINDNEWFYRVKMHVVFSGPTKKRVNDLWVFLRIKRSAAGQLGVEKVVAYPVSFEQTSST